MIAAVVIPAAAQQPPASVQQPQVKVNVLNVCAPSADEQKELSSALGKVPGKPAFSTDYEVSRGRSTLDASTPIPGMQPLPPGTTSVADWVRVRREFPSGTLFSNVQYSFSVDSSRHGGDSGFARARIQGHDPGFDLRTTPRRLTSASRDVGSGNTGIAGPAGDDLGSRRWR